MKHVFWVHSHTSYLTTMGVINKLQLSYKEVIFFTGRKYKCIGLPKEIKQYDADSDDFYHYQYSFKHIRKTIESIRQFDKFIEDIIGDEFIFYCEHIVLITFQLIASNRLCVDLKFIQESIIDSCAGKNAKRKYPLGLVIRHFLANIIGNEFRRTKPLPTSGNYWDDYPKAVRHASETFAISEHLFNKLECKHTIVEWPRIKIPLKLEDDGVYFVLASSVERHDIERDIYMVQVEKLIKKFAGVHNYIKFHPSQKEENKKYILTLFEKNNIKVEVLPDDVPFEIILSTQPHMKVCGFSTSLVFFSALMPQHETHLCLPALCVSKLFEKRYYNDFVDNLKRCYGDAFKMENL